MLNNPLKYVDVNGESPKALIYVADQYHGEVLYNVNDHVLNAVFWFKESYESLGYDVELVTVRHSGVVGDKLTLRLHESGAGVISLGSERGAYYHALGEEEYDIVAIMAHSRALEGGGTVVDLSYGGWTTRVQPTSNFNQKTQGGCLEVYGCALGGVGGSVLIRSYPKFAKLRKHYSYEEILEKTQSGRGYLLNGGAPEANLIFSAPKSPRLIELESKFMLETLEIYQEFYDVPIPEPQFRNLGYADNKLEIPELE